MKRVTSAGSMPFSQIILPSPSPTESKRLFYTSVSLLLSHIQLYCYHLSKFHIIKCPSKMVGAARGHQRAETLKPYSQKTSQSNHTRTTALSNSMKPSHACRATQDRRVMVERSDRMWSTGEGNGKPHQYSCLESPMNNMKRQKVRTLKNELPEVGRCPICYWISVEK